MNIINLVLEQIDFYCILNFFKLWEKKQLTLCQIKTHKKIIDYDNSKFTYSKGDKTMMFINKQESLEEFVNTYEHEKNHIEMYLCLKYNIDPYSEEASILSGELSKILFLELTNVILLK